MSDERPTGPASVPLRRNRDFVLLWSANLASTLGTQVASVAYPLIALDLTGSATQAGLLGSAGMVTALGLRLPAGALVDRWDRRRTMLTCDLLRAALLTTVVTSLILGRLDFWMLLAATMVGAACGVLFHPAETSVLRRIVPSDRLPQAMAQNEARYHAAAVAGPPLGGLLFGLGRAVPLAGEVLAYLFSFLAVLLIRAPMDVQQRERKSQNLFQDIIKGFRWTWNQRLLRVMLLAAAGLSLVYPALTFAAVVVAKHGGATSAEVGLMMGMASMGGLLGAVCAPWLQRCSPTLVILAMFWIAAAVIPLMTVDSTTLTIGALLAAMLFTAPAANGILGAYQIAVTPDRMQGRVISSLAFIGGIASPIGPLMSGLIIDRWGATAALIAIGLIMLVVAVGTTLNPTIRNLPSLAAAAQSNV